MVNVNDTYVWDEITGIDFILFYLYYKVTLLQMDKSNGEESKI